MKSLIKKTNIPLLFALMGIICVYCYWIDNAKCIVPYSDFFRWVLDYGERIQKGNGMVSFFFADGSQHYQPGIYLLSFSLLQVTHYNFSILPIAGMIVKVIVCILVIVLFISVCHPSKVNLYIGTIFISLITLNFNQWEIITEPFAFASAIRIGLLIGVFWLTAYIFSDNKMKNNCRKYVIVIIGALICDLFIITMCGGYAFAVAFSLILNVLIFVLNSVDKNSYVHAAIFIVLILVGIFIYMQLVSSGSNQFEFSLENLIAIFAGFFMFWGASVLPTSIENKEGVFEIYSIVGAGIVIIMLLLFLMCLFRSLKEKNKKYLFIMLLITYANALGFSISLARVPEYGISVMVSSRYVIDSAIGLIACAFGVEFIISVCKKKTSNIKIGEILVCCLCVLLAATNFIEGCNSVYIGQFYKNVETQLENIEECSDEFLQSISATDAETTRKSLYFMKENKLSIYY